MFVGVLSDVGGLSAEELSFKEVDGIRWLDVRQLGVEGQGWRDVKSPFDRLPAKAEGVVRDAVWNLSRHSAGLAVRFVTDAKELRARWTLTSANLAMPHMPATGVSGLDLYAKDDEGRWRWLACGFPREQTNDITLASGLPGTEREFLLYLPLYNGVAEASIGAPAGSELRRAPAYAADHARPIVFYGTSITHGACASRPGMCHPAILGRWYHRPVINLGFSGNGVMEKEIGALLAELDAHVYVIDCLPNMNAAQVAERTRPLVDQLRAAHPDTPIVLVEDRNYTNSWLLEGPRGRNASSQAALKRAFQEMIADGIKNLHYIPGADLLGDDAEGAVDSSHPSDLGFLRQAEAFDKVLGPLCRSSGVPSRH
jgi:hypothetical protein